MAEQGDQYAQATLAEMYATGQGAPQNFAEAVKWYRLAADQGNPIAQRALGALYATGRGVHRTMLRLQSGYARLPTKDIPTES